MTDLPDDDFERIAAALHKVWLERSDHFGTVDRRPWSELSGRERDYGLMLAVAAREAARPQWLPIATAPKDGTSILVAAGQFQEVTSAQWVSAGRGWWSLSVPGDHCAGQDLDHVTHWMLLPAPPIKP